MVFTQAIWPGDFARRFRQAISVERFHCLGISIENLKSPEIETFLSGEIAYPGDLDRIIPVETSSLTEIAC